MLFAFTVIVASGFQIPWSEEAVLYAIYGGGAGFYLAIAMGMLVVWKINKKRT